MADILSSDVLEKQFGPTEITVLYQDASTRIICTRAVDGGQVLELSRVSFAPGVREFPGTHRAVLDGRSMGKAFRHDGIEFRRRVGSSYKRALPANFSRWFDSDEPATVISVAILAGPGAILYAEILETYSPAVDWAQHSDSRPAAGDTAAIKAMDEFLAGQPAVR